MANANNNLTDITPFLYQALDETPFHATSITPIAIVPKFDLSSKAFTGISKAIIKITDGYQLGDTLELDSNYTLFNTSNNALKIENTNVMLVDGGFNSTNKQLVLAGLDSTDTYESLLESILLDNCHGIADCHREISFTVIDDEGHKHWLGKIGLDADLTMTDTSTVLNDIFADPNMASLLTDYQHGDLQPIDPRLLLQEADVLLPEENVFIFGPGFGHESIEIFTYPELPHVIQLTGVTQGPSLELSAHNSWMLKIEPNANYYIEHNKIVFANSASGTVLLADGSDLQFKNVDMIMWAA